MDEKKVEERAREIGERPAFPVALHPSFLLAREGGVVTCFRRETGMTYRMWLVGQVLCGSAAAAREDECWDRAQEWAVFDGVHTTLVELAREELEREEDSRG